MDFCRKSSRFADFENTADRGSAVNFSADSGLCTSLCSDLGF